MLNVHKLQYIFISSIHVSYVLSMIPNIALYTPNSTDLIDHFLCVRQGKLMTTIYNSPLYILSTNCIK